MCMCGGSVRFASLLTLYLAPFSRAITNGIIDAPVMTFPMREKKKQKRATGDNGATMVATITRYIPLVVERG